MIHFGSALFDKLLLAITTGRLVSLLGPSNANLFSLNVRIVTSF